MALDEALMTSAREGVVTLRLYGWSPPCLSFGRNQAARGRYDPEAARARGIDVVRRPTGGRAVLHRREITYSVTAPAGLWGGLRECYGRINRGLARGLAEVGVPLDSVASFETRSGGTNAAPLPLARACFRDPLPGELTSGGRKLVGSAQWRVDGALLQHGSILIHDDQSQVDALLLTPPAGEPLSTGACSIHELLGRVPPGEKMLSALAAGFADEFDVRLEPGEPDPSVQRAARSLEARYLDPGWTWRR
jgi:lipoate-protein ligase A